MDSSIGQTIVKNDKDGEDNGVLDLRRIWRC